VLAAIRFVTDVLREEEFVAAGKAGA